MSASSSFVHAVANTYINKSIRLVREDNYAPNFEKKLWGIMLLACLFIRSFVRLLVGSFVRHSFWCIA